MSWEKESLWEKSKFFMEKAFSGPLDESDFGLWCSFGLETLARAVVSSVSPALLAEPDREQKNILYALGRPTDRTQPKSLSNSQVFILCQKLFADFTSEHKKSAIALLNRRNEELHTGTAAFEQYPMQQWIVGFYKCCSVLCNEMDEQLATLLGDEQAKIAGQRLRESETEVIQQVKDSIAAHHKVFESYADEEKGEAKQKAEETVKKLIYQHHLYQRHHKVSCPSCSSDAAVAGPAFGLEDVKYTEDKIVTKQLVIPNEFSCTACNLKLSGYAELNIAELGRRYIQTSCISPEDYFGLLNPDDYVISDLVEDHLLENPHIIDDHLRARMEDDNE